MEDEFDGDTPLDEGSEELEALGDHLILELAGPEEDRTPSGLLIPKSASQPPNGYARFRVLAAGPFCSEDRVSEFPEPSVGPGDLVLAPTGDLGLYREGGITYFIATFEQIAAVIRGG